MLVRRIPGPHARGSELPAQRRIADSPNPEINATRRELLHQAQAAVYELRANQVMAFSVPESRGYDDHPNTLALLPQAAKVGALRAATGRPIRPTTHGAFGDDRPSRR